MAKRKAEEADAEDEASGEAAKKEASAEKKKKKKKSTSGETPTKEDNDTSDASKKKKKKAKKEEDADDDAEEAREEGGGDKSGATPPAHPSAKTYQERLVALSPIAHPLADEKLTLKLHKLVNKASAAKALRRGVKEVVKAVRKGAKGLCVIAGDIAPIDVICHLPIFCEEKDVPYVYVPSKQDLGYAALTKRPTSCVLVSPKPGQPFDSQDLLDKTLAKVRKAQPMA